MSNKFNISPLPLNNGGNRLPINVPAVIPTPKKAFVLAASGIYGNFKAKTLQDNVSADPSDPIIATTYLGTPLQTQIILKKTIGTVAGPGTSGDGWAIFQTAIAKVEQPRNIVRTPINGLDGTVKEYISNGDYEIDIIGEMVSPYPDTAPHDDIRNINNLITLPNEIIIVSDFIACFSISYCVVARAAVSQKIGSRNSLQFNMTLWSDSPIEVKLGISNA